MLDKAKYHLLLDALKEYLHLNEYPDVIIMQWTETIQFINILKQYFASSKYIAIEEDVAFLGYKRKYEASHGIYKIYRRLKYKYLKKMEIETLRKCDIVVTLNDKDKKLLINEKIHEDKIFQACAYHAFPQSCTYAPDIYQLLFYGAMSRVENYKSVIWFIEEVMPLLNSNYKLVIVGSKPDKSLMAYESERIHLTGFVEDVQQFFESSLCLVSPLVLGAGIKIKVLEALSAGLPVITNSIGAEGIGLTDKKNYLHAELPKEYADAINMLNSDITLRMKLSNEGRAHIKKNFNVNNTLDGLIRKIIMLK